MMPHNPPYYDALHDRYGFVKAKDEDNAPMNNAVARLGFRRYETYRVYDKAL